jgi:3-oxoacyl-[acyl-carrier protein] reductase
MNDAMKRALVTGGSGGIGAAICRQLGAMGHFVYVHANRSRATADAVVNDIVAAGGAAETIVFDVTDAATSRTALESLIEAMPVQILVNNAGIHDDAAFPGMSAQQWHRVIDVSIDGFYNVTHPLILPMIRTRWGRIINISSVAALSGNRGQVNYAAAKGAINSATKALESGGGEPRHHRQRGGPGHHRHQHECTDLQPASHRGFGPHEARGYRR